MQKTKLKPIDVTDKRKKGEREHEEAMQKAVARNSFEIMQHWKSWKKLAN